MRHPPTLGRGILTAGLLAAGLLAGCDGEVPPEVARLGFVDRAERFAMDVPAGWSVESDGAVAAVLVTGPAGGAGVRSNVNVVVDAAPAASAPEDLAEQRKRRLAALKGFRLLAEETRSLADGRQALVLTFRQEALGRPLAQRQMVVAAAGRLYTVTATAAEDRWADEEANLETCLRSFRAGW